MSIRRILRRRVTLAGMSAAAFGLLGCNIAFDGVGDPPAGGGTTPGNEVIVRFLNLTVTEAVDIQFHTSSEALDTLPDDLFTEQHLVTRSLGVAGTGILGPRTADQISIPCSADLVLGVAEARFLDAETGDEQGEGMARWIEEGPLGLCGAVVTFEFVRSGDTFDTRVSISNE